MTTTDGAKGLYIPYDTTLATECTLRLASDGQPRCLPLANASTGSFYADSSCTTPLAQAPTVCGSSPLGSYALHYTYVGKAGGMNGPWQVSVYSLGATYTGNVYTGTPAQCSQDTNLPSYPLYTVGGEVAASTFASMTVHAPGSGPTPSTSDLEQNGSRIGWETMTTADGFSGAYFAYDSSLAQQCLYEYAGDGANRCVPYYTGDISDYFADSTCTTPVFDTDTSAAGLFAYAETYSATACPTGTFYSVGSALGGTAYTNPGGTCEAASPDSSVVYYQVTPFSSSGFEALVPDATAGPFATTASGSRLKTVVATGSDGARMGAGWHDAALGVDCYVYTANDGVVRCIPSQMAYAGYYYSDAACSKPLVYSAGCNAPQYAETVACGGDYYEVGALYTGTVYYDTGTSCITTTMSLPTYERGAVVSASTFVAVTIAH
jgi:hypothetical protein